MGRITSLTDSLSRSSDCISRSNVALRSFEARRNSVIAFAIVRPSSGSFFGPNRTRATRKMAIISCTPIGPIVCPLFFLKILRAIPRLHPEYKIFDFGLLGARLPACRRRTLVRGPRKAPRIYVKIGGNPYADFVLKSDEAMKPYLYPLRAATGTIVTRHWPMEK